MMNKKWILLSIFALASNSLVMSNPGDFGFSKKMPDQFCFSQELINTVSYGSMLGLTGGAIGYLSSTLFDSVANKYMLERVHSLYGSKFEVLLVATLCKVAAQVGSKAYWEKPLRNKLTNWLTEELDKYGIVYHKEAMKTVSRLTSWLFFVPFIG